MPLYEYACRECGHTFEILQRLGEGAEGLKCPRCDKPEPARQFSTFAAQVSGASAALSCTPQGCGAPACGTGFT